MLRGFQGFAKFISLGRGTGLFLLSIGVTFLVIDSYNWLTAFYLGAIVFCGWSGFDAINNIYDVDLDAYSDPQRAQFAKKLGKSGVIIAILFMALCLALAAFTMILLVTFLVGLGILLGILYSVPPVRLRITVFKPVLNFAVGLGPVLLAAAYFNTFTINVLTLAMLIGVATSVHSTWEDLGDFASDFKAESRTIPVLLGLRNGIFFTIALFCSLLSPLMVMVGVLFQLGWTYYAVLGMLAAATFFRIIQKRRILFGDQKNDAQKMKQLGIILSKDHSIIALIFTINLLLSSLLKTGFIP